MSRPKRSTATPVLYSETALSYRVEDDFQEKRDPRRQKSKKSNSERLKNDDSLDNEKVHGLDDQIANGPTDEEFQPEKVEDDDLCGDENKKKVRSSTSKSKNKSSHIKSRGHVKNETQSKRQSSRSLNRASRTVYNDPSSDEFEEMLMDYEPDEEDYKLPISDSKGNHVPNLFTSPDSDALGIQSQIIPSSKTNETNISKNNDQNKRPRKDIITKISVSTSPANGVADNAEAEDGDIADEGYAPIETDIEYRIQHILGARAMTVEEWRSFTAGMKTQEIENGSVLVSQATSEVELQKTAKDTKTKFLIKWSHASYLHVSWESEEDLILLIGAQKAKQSIRKYYERVELNKDIFEDLRAGEYFPPVFLQVERVLDVDGETDPLTIDWKNAVLPPYVKPPFVGAEPANALNADNDVMNDKIADAAESARSSSSIPKEELQEEGVVVDALEVIECSADNASSVVGLEPALGQTDGGATWPSTKKADVNNDTNVNTSSERAIGLTVSSVNEDASMKAQDEENEHTSPATATAPAATCTSTSDPVPDPTTASGPSRRPTRLAKDIAVRALSRTTVAERLNRNPINASSPIEDMDSSSITKRRTSGSSGGKGSIKFLHGPNCFVTVKWEGLGYSEVTFENVNDLRNRGIEYESQLRDFYKREQTKPIPLTRAKKSNINRTIDQRLFKKQCPIPLPGGGTLRDYQWEGVQWLLFNWSQNRNSILADEMGLGKTIQTACFLQLLNTFQKLRGPILIVVPLSTVINWQRELAQWTDMDVVVYHGSQEDRETIRLHEFFYLSRGSAAGYKLEILLTTPEVCLCVDGKDSLGRSTGLALSKVPWELMIVDEAHKLKNYTSKIAVTLRETYSYTNCVLLTGTPLQNNVDELWALLNFIAKDVFSDRTEFSASFGSLQQSEQVEALHQKLRPYLLQRKKETVEKMIPPKEEQIIEVEMTVPQKQYYRAIYEQNRAFLTRSGGPMPSLTNLVMELRKCCNHPFLIRGAETELVQHFSRDSYIEVLVKCSGKLVLLDKLLPKLRADNHKVLIFSQFRIMLDILVDYLNLRNFSYERIDGAITGRRRQAAIDRFSVPGSELFIMLLSTRAGGVGINLTTADTVIIFDSDWNPQNDLQAQARAHRIGQKKSVKVYRLLTCKTYERVMFDAASLKLGLDYAIMHNMGLQKGLLESSKNKKRKSKNGDDEADGIETSGSGSSLSKSEIERLLKHGAYDIFQEEKEGTGEEASRQFCEADIEKILERSQVIIHDTGKASTTAVASVMGSFSKASFVTDSTSGSNLSVDDPDFWEKVVGLKVVEEKEDDKVGGRLRRRRKVNELYNTGDLDQLDALLEIEDKDADEYYNELGPRDADEKRKRGVKSNTSSASGGSVPTNLLQTSTKKSNETSTTSSRKSKVNLSESEKIVAVMDAMQVRPYLNWKAIGEDLFLNHRLNLSHEEIAHYCRIGIMYMLRMLCLSPGPTFAVLDPTQLLFRLSSSRLFRFALLSVMQYRDWKETNQSGYPQSSASMLPQTQMQTHLQTLQTNTHMQTNVETVETPSNMQMFSNSARQIFFPTLITNPSPSLLLSSLNPTSSVPTMVLPGLHRLHESPPSTIFEKEVLSLNFTFGTTSFITTSPYAHRLLLPETFQVFSDPKSLEDDKLELVMSIVSLLSWLKLPDESIDSKKLMSMKKLYLNKFQSCSDLFELQLCVDMAKRYAIGMGRNVLQENELSIATSSSSLLVNSAGPVSAVQTVLSSAVRNVLTTSGDTEALLTSFACTRSTLQVFHQHFRNFVCLEEGPAIWWTAMHDALLVLAVSKEGNPTSSGPFCGTRLLALRDWIQLQVTSLKLSDNISIFMPEGNRFLDADSLRERLKELIIVLSGELLPAKPKRISLHVLRIVSHFGAPSFLNNSQSSQFVLDSVQKSVPSFTMDAFIHILCQLGWPDNTDIRHRVLGILSELVSFNSHTYMSSKSNWFFAVPVALIQEAKEGMLAMHYLRSYVWGCSQDTLFTVLTNSVTLPQLNGNDANFSWWTYAHDIQLLLGVINLGYGKWQALAQDFRNVKKMAPPTLDTVSGHDFLKRRFRFVIHCLCVIDENGSLNILLNRFGTNPKALQVSNTPVQVESQESIVDNQVHESVIQTAVVTCLPSDVTLRNLSESNNMVDLTLKKSIPSSASSYPTAEGLMLKDDGVCTSSQPVTNVGSAKLQCMKAIAAFQKVGLVVKDVLMDVNLWREINSEVASIRQVVMSLSQELYNIYSCIQITDIEVSPAVKAGLSLIRLELLKLKNDVATKINSGQYNQFHVPFTLLVEHTLLTIELISELQHQAIPHTQESCVVHQQSIPSSDLLPEQKVEQSNPNDDVQGCLEPHNASISSIIDPNIISRMTPVQYMFYLKGIKNMLQVDGDNTETGHDTTAQLMEPSVVPSNGVRISNSSGQELKHRLDSSTTVSGNRHNQSRSNVVKSDIFSIIPEIRQEFFNCLDYISHYDVRHGSCDGVAFHREEAVMVSLFEVEVVTTDDCADVADVCLQSQPMTSAVVVSQSVEEESLDVSSSSTAQAEVESTE